MSGGGIVRRSMPFGAVFLVSVLFLACSGSAPTAAPAQRRCQAGGRPPVAAATPASGARRIARPRVVPAAPSNPGQYIVRTGTLDGGGHGR